MIVNDYNNIIRRKSFSKVITIEDDGDADGYVFPNTNGFLDGIQRKRNAEKLHGILKRIR
jgi:hypothetical protein